MSLGKPCFKLNSAKLEFKVLLSCAVIDIVYRLCVIAEKLDWNNIPVILHPYVVGHPKHTSGNKNLMSVYNASKDSTASMQP